MKARVILNRSVRRVTIDRLPFRWILPVGVRRDLRRATEACFGMKTNGIDEVYTLVDPPFIFLYTTIWCGDTWVNAKVMAECVKGNIKFREAELRYIPGRRTFESAGLDVTISEEE